MIMNGSKKMLGGWSGGNCVIGKFYSRHRCVLLPAGEWDHCRIQCFGLSTGWSP